MDDQTLLTLRYIPLSAAREWERNPKRHDIPGIIASIRLYGFQDPPKFDTSLNNGEGGLAHGNGRTHALAIMQANGEDPPRGIAVDDVGEWTIPVIFGNDQPSEAIATAYAIDHNNLTLIGGDFSPMQTVRMWNAREYALLLAEAGAETLPTTISESQAATLVSSILEETKTTAVKEDDDTQPIRITVGAYRVRGIDPLQFLRWQNELVGLTDGSDEEVLAIMFDRLDITRFLNDN